MSKIGNWLLKYWPILVVVVPLLVGSVVAVAVAGQKILTLEDAAKSQKDQSEAIQAIQMQQGVFQVEQTHMKKSVDNILFELRENRAIMIQMLQDR